MPPSSPAIHLWYLISLFEYIFDSIKADFTLTSKELDTQSISIAKAIEIVLTKYATPLTKEAILTEILRLRPDTKEASFASMINMLHRQESINYYQGGLIGIKGKRYGRGYKTTKRLQRAVKSE